MGEYMQYRGYDLRQRQAKLRKALARETLTSAEDLPIIANTPCYFAFGGKHVPDDYFTNPASMVQYQADGYERHLAAVQDDLVPYLMPWLGTGVLASAFGCEIVTEPGPGHDPAVAGPCIQSPRDAARLHLPDPSRDGWMPRVLAIIDHARAHSDLPPGLTDMQGPLDTLGLICGQANLYQWMYQEPKMIHELMALVTEAFIQWVKLQKAHIGEPLDSSNGLQGVWAPQGLGVWESDDDLVLLDAGLYREFVVPHVARILETFGGGSVHFCGKGLHHLDNFKQMPYLRVINTSPMGNFQAVAELKRALGDRVTIQLQDSAPRDVEEYYSGLFGAFDDLRGLALTTFVNDSVAMDMAGGYEDIDWQPFDTANRIVRVVRECVRKRLAGETLAGQQAARPAPPAQVAASAAESARPALTPAQEAALLAVRERMIKFDREGLKAAVRAAIAAQVMAFGIVTQGLAAAMSEVGRLYESGEFFLPQLLMAGATMKEGMSVLAPLLAAGQSAGQPKGVIVLGTVQGDMHDIGKNIVKTMLEAAGFAVHDIGVNQPAASFVRKALDTHADIVGLSALLTTTMANMAGIVQALREAGLGERVRVMVGGAPISREFANHIGAAGFAPDAVKAVHEAERLMDDIRRKS